MGYLSNAWVESHEEDRARYDELKVKLSDKVLLKDEQDEFEALKAQINNQ